MAGRRLEGIRAIKPALTILVGTLSDEQKKMADELLAPHMGMMAMMSAMSGSLIAIIIALALWNLTLKILLSI
jgi:hypothetical protein